MWPSAKSSIPADTSTCVWKLKVKIVCNAQWFSAVLSGGLHYSSERRQKAVCSMDNCPPSLSLTDVLGSHSMKHFEAFLSILGRILFSPYPDTDKAACNCSAPWEYPVLLHLHVCFCCCSFRCEDSIWETYCCSLTCHLNGNNTKLNSLLNTVDTVWYHKACCNALCCSDRPWRPPWGRMATKIPCLTRKILSWLLLSVCIQGDVSSDFSKNSLKTTDI